MAAGWLGKLFSSGARELADSVGSTVARVSEAHLGKKELALELERLVAESFNKTADLVTTEIQAKERVLVAELQQGDSFTKRARPLIAISGIAMALVEVVFRFILLRQGSVDFSQVASVPALVPEAFWLGWTGITGTWAVGRTVEKVKANGRIGDVARVITGSRKERMTILGGDE